MVRNQYRYYRTLIDMPSLLIAGAALAIWMLWPKIHRMSESRDLPPPRVFSMHMKTDDNSLAMSPALFAIPSPMGFSGLDLGGVPDVPGALSDRPPHFLKRHPFSTDRDYGFPDSSLLRKNVKASLSGYVHRSGSRKVLEQPKSPEMRLIVEPSGPLKQRGFSTPPIPDEDIKYLDTAWMVSLVVDIDEDGDVENVFVENGCDDHNINDMVIRMASKGRLAKTGGRCSGRVTVNFGAW